MLLILMLAFVHSHSISLPFSIQTKSLIFYTSDGQTVSIPVDFASNKLYLNTVIFLDPHFKYKIQGQSQIQFKQYFQQKTKTNFYSSTKNKLDDMNLIGLGKGNKLMKQIAKSLHINAIKIQLYVDKFVIIPHQCLQSISFPLMTTLHSTNAFSSSDQWYSIKAISTNFYPSLSFSTPFPVSIKSEDMVSVTIEGEKHNLLLKDLMSCHKYSQSDRYQCEVEQNRIEDIGKILLLSNVVLCQDGKIQWNYLSNQPMKIYYYFHIAFLIISMVIAEKYYFSQ